MNEQEKSHWLTWSKSEIKQFLRIFTMLLLVLAFGTALLIITHNSTRRDRALQEKLDTITAQLTEIAAHNDLLAEQIAAKENELIRLAQENTALTTKLSAQSEQTLTVDEAEALQQQIKTMEKRLGVYGHYYMAAENWVSVDPNVSISKGGIYVLDPDMGQTYFVLEISTEPEKELLRAYREKLQPVAYSYDLFAETYLPRNIVVFEDGYHLALLLNGYAAGGTALDKLTDFYLCDSSFMPYVNNLSVAASRPTYAVYLEQDGEFSVQSLYGAAEEENDVAIQLVDVQIKDDGFLIVFETQVDGTKTSGMWSDYNNGGCLVGVRNRVTVELNGRQRWVLDISFSIPDEHGLTWNIWFGIAGAQFLLHV